MKTTIVAAAGRRITVADVLTEAGESCLRITILNANKEPAAVCTLRPAEAGLLASALETAGAACEAAEAARMESLLWGEGVGHV